MHDMTHVWNRVIGVEQRGYTWHFSCTSKLAQTSDATSSHARYNLHVDAMATASLTSLHISITSQTLHIQTLSNYNTIQTSTMAPRTLMAFRPISAFSPIARRTFSTTRHMQIKEDGNRSAQELEQKKQEQLREQKEGKGRWREDLASSGESNIAADKQKVEDHKSHMQELQEQTKQKGEKGEL
jgi:hypothetical protein